MKRLSKSHYTLFNQCPKALWLRVSLLNYCKVDTWAMVKVWQKLKEVTV